MEHFDKRVSIGVAEKCKELAEYAKDNLGMYPKAESFGCPNLDKIDGVEVSGFVPYQYGGYSVTELIRFDMDCSYHLTSGMTAYANKLYEDMLESFELDNKLESVEWDDLTEEQRNELRDYECEWFEPAMLKFEVYVGNKSYYDDSIDLSHVYLELSVCYSDAPYYRSSIFAPLHSMTILCDDFIGMDCEYIWNQLLKSEA